MLAAFLKFVRQCTCHVPHIERLQHAWLWNIGFNWIRHDRGSRLSDRIDISKRRKYDELSVDR